MNLPASTKICWQVFGISYPLKKTAKIPITKFFLSWLKRENNNLQTVKFGIRIKIRDSK